MPRRGRASVSSKRHRAISWSFWWTNSSTFARCKSSGEYPQIRSADGLWYSISPSAVTVMMTSVVLSTSDRNRSSLSRSSRRSRSSRAISAPRASNNPRTVSPIPTSRLRPTSHISANSQGDTASRPSVANATPTSGGPATRHTPPRPAASSIIRPRCCEARPWSASRTRRVAAIMPWSDIVASLSCPWSGLPSEGVTSVDKNRGPDGLPGGAPVAPIRSPDRSQRAMSAQASAR